MITKQEFREACAYLTNSGALSGSGALFIDIKNQRVLDEGNENQDITPDEPTLTQALIDFGTQNSNKQASDALDTLTKAQIKGYLKAQLINASPNWATIKTTIESAIGSNAQAQQTISNIAALFEYDDTTASGYVRCALLAVTILVD